MTELDLRTLRMLVAVADEAVMGRAAHRLHVSQPALSKQLAQAERITGLILFERHAKGMTPTPAGQIIVDRARVVLQEVDRLSAVARRLRLQLQGELHLGYIAQTLNEKTRAVVGEFERRHVGITVHRRQYDLRDMTAGLLSDQSDVALLRQPLSAPELVHEPIMVEQRVALLPPDHPAASSSTTVLADLFDTPWVVNATDDPTFRRYQLATDQRAGRRPVLGPVVHTTDEFLEAVVSGRAIGLAPASAARYYPRPGVVFVPVRDAEPSVCTLSWRRDRPLSSAVKALIGLVRTRLPI